MADGEASQDVDLARLIGWYETPSGMDRATFVTEAGPEALRIADAVPDLADVGDDTLVMRAEAWRDFMPGSWGSGGSPLMVPIIVTTLVPGVFPPLLRPEWVAVVNGERVWMTYGVLESLSFEHGADCYRVMARYGPRWDPGINVDVLLQLRDRRERSYRLRVASVSIQESS